MRGGDIKAGNSVKGDDAVGLMMKWGGLGKGGWAIKTVGAGIVGTWVGVANAAQHGGGARRALIRVGAVASRGGAFGQGDAVRSGQGEAARRILVGTDG